MKNKQPYEINMDLVFQMVNLCNKITKQLYKMPRYIDLDDESREVVNGFVRNLLLYNHYSNSDENWNHNPMDTKQIDWDELGSYSVE